MQNAKKPEQHDAKPMERLRFSTTVLRLLGEELNPSPDQGILELIKNAYDADAKQCTVELKGVHLRGGSIRVWDDGNGMTADEIRNGWLIVGDSLKNRNAESPAGRPLVGSKGLGRLGALRLGQLVTLTTRSIKEPGIQYRVEVDWQAFELRPSTNNSVGCVRIADPDGIFQQKTDRLGFVDSEAFDELRRFADDVLDWMGRERVKERDRRRKAQLEVNRQEKQEAEIFVKEALKTLPVAQRKSISAAIEKLKTAHQTEVELKDETAQLYFTLGTVGTTAAAFAHQTKVPIKGILNDANTLDEYLGDPQMLTLYRQESSKAVKRIQSEANAIYSFSILRGS